MTRDYLVEDIRRIREEQAAQYGFQIRAILAAAKKRQRKSGFRVVSFVPGKPRLKRRSTRLPANVATGDAGCV